MLDPDLTNVLKRRIVASLIDVGIAAFVTLGVWRSQLIAFPISSRDMITDLPIWSAEQQARRDAIAESLNTSFTWGNTEYAIDQTGIVLTALCGIVMFLLLFVLLPANTGWSPGKKLLGLGVVDDEGNNPSIPAYLIRSAVGVVDVLPVIVPGLAGWLLARSDDFHRRLGDRVAGTYVIDSNVGARFIDASVYARRNELRRAATATHEPVGDDDEMVQIGDRLGGSQSGLHRDDLEAAEAVVAVEAPGASEMDHAAPAPVDDLGSVDRASLEHEVFDPSQLGADMLDELPAPAVDDSADLAPLPPVADSLDTLPPLPSPGAHGAIEHAMDSDRPSISGPDGSGHEAAVAAADQGRSEISGIDLSHGGSGSPAPAPAPSHRSPADAHNLDDFATASTPVDEPAAPASTNTAPTPSASAASELDLGAGGSASHSSVPKPTHRGATQPEPEWEQPTPEPAPVWEPNGSSASFEPAGATITETTDQPGSSLTDWSIRTTSDGDTAPADDAPSSEAPTADDSNQDSGTASATGSGTGSSGPTSEAPAEGLVWNEQWQAWLFWDAEHEHWLRHDIDRDRWVPIS